MFIYGADFFLFKPGLVFIALGLLLTVPVSLGALDVGPATLSLNWQILGLVTLVIGLQAFFLGCIAQVLFDYTGRRRRRWLGIFRYTRTVLVSFGLVALGIGLSVPLVKAYLETTSPCAARTRRRTTLPVTGLAAVLCGVQLFVFTLLLHGTVLAMNGRRET